MTDFDPQPMKAEIYVLYAVCIYAVLNIAFIGMSAVLVPLLGPAWPTRFLTMSRLSGGLSLVAFLWWTLEVRLTVRLLSAVILAAVSIVHLWAAHSSSAAV